VLPWPTSSVARNEGSAKKAEVLGLAASCATHDGQPTEHVRPFRPTPLPGVSVGKGGGLQERSQACLLKGIRCGKEGCDLSHAVTSTSRGGANLFIARGHAVQKHLVGSFVAQALQETWAR
jgi:hypothetical protein